ncbi:hypothetical protein B484DRAFT_458282 [Ochromonadaceae sp. CCMP2298]|nr:hypothetical protein B484DRAFT_458282 [Ochromonadaceae sp. CCMP2298]|mmetsp:Transcript_21896/g.48665  ORF Transcript_21896/g.48665 Transcript_21896/m.48665 type:complete len:349 (-) Transcript_21896:48-1094(-)
MTPLLLLLALAALCLGGTASKSPVAASVSASASATVSAASASTTASPASSVKASVYIRPAYITQALSSNTPVYYVGVGSNMLRSKVTNRGANGTTIALRSFGPGRVPGFRLAFNLRGFPPLEPGMGGIEPDNEGTLHGALMQLDAQEYQKLWLSEGGGMDNPGYIEEVVDAYAYGAIKPVKAIALRAAQHSRLSRDAEPSARYMGILTEGARELGLEPSYQAYLEALPTASPPRALVWLARRSLSLLSLLFRLKIRSVFRVWSRILYAVYVPSTYWWPLVRLSELTTGLLLLLPAVLGLGVELYRKAAGKPALGMFGQPVKPTPTVGEKEMGAGGAGAEPKAAVAAAA